MTDSAAGGTTRFRHYLTIVALIMAGEAVFFLPYLTVRLFRPTVLLVFEITNLELGIAFSLYGAVAMVSYALGGPLADRYAARTLMSVALAVTALGGLSMMTPVPAAVATAIFLLTTFGSRYISLGSIVGVLAGAATLVGLALAGWYSSTYMYFAGGAAVMIIWQHRDNIQRLINGNERRLGAPATSVE